MLYHSSSKICRHLFSGAYGAFHDVFDTRRLVDNKLDPDKFLAMDVGMWNTISINFGLDLLYSKARCVCRKRVRRNFFFLGLNACIYNIHRSIIVPKVDNMPRTLILIIRIDRLTSISIGL